MIKNLVKLTSSALPTEFGEFTIHVYRDLRNSVEHVVLVMGEVAARNNILTRVHSECLTGDIFGSTRCDCGEQLALAQKMIAAEGRGVIIYLRNHEGRGIGLANKIRAYDYQDKGLDTVEANLALGLPIDSRSFEAAAEILEILSVESISLMSNNPNKFSALRDLGVNITRHVPLTIVPNKNNLKYLQTKKVKLGHTLTT